MSGGEKTFKYVPHAKVHEHIASGWIAHDSLEGTNDAYGVTDHGHWSVLMEYVGTEDSAANTATAQGALKCVGGDAP